MAFSPDSRLFSSLCSGDVRVWNLCDFSTSNINPDGKVSTKLSPDPNSICTSTSGSNYVRTNHGVNQVSFKFPNSLSRFDKIIKFSPGGKLLVCCVVAAASIELWDGKTGELLGNSGSPGNLGYHRLNNVACSPDCQILAASGDYGNICLWDVNSLISDRNSYDLSVITTGAILSSPNGKLIACHTCVLGAGGKLRLWDATTGTVHGLHKDLSKLGYIHSLEWSPCGRLLALHLPSSQHIQVWDMIQETLYWVSVTPVTHFLFAPDGIYLACCISTDIKLYNIMNRTLLWRSRRDIDRWQKWCVAFSSDSKLLIYIASPVKVLVSYAETGEIYATISQDSTIINAVSFSPNGKLIAISDDTCTIPLWSVATKDVAYKLQSKDKVTRMSFCLSGRFLHINGPRESMDLEHTLNDDDRPWIQTKYSPRLCNDWIFIGLERILWVPVDFRPTGENVFAIRSNLIPL
ncbi:hypothetical protein FPQ18DRAFT_17907 [Pyronema domesticum]|nr:hypothetical protein FPQ18DRAFT_17907 [Pyronema domesticum]